MMMASSELCQQPKPIFNLTSSYKTGVIHMEGLV